MKYTFVDIINIEMYNKSYYYFYFYLTDIKD